MDAPPREDLWKLYISGVEEYRFQVLLNSQRFQWYVTLDVALITVGTGLLRLSGSGRGETLTALVFFVGAVLAAFTARAVAQGVTYQHSARTQVQKAAEALQVKEFSVATTGGWRDTPTARWMKIRTVNYALLLVLGLVNVTGLLYVVTR